MSNAYARHAVATASGGPTFTMTLNGPAAWALSGGSNLATLSTTPGDLRLNAGPNGPWAQGPKGVTVQAGTGNVGVGSTAPAQALDVSGSVQVSGTVSAANVTVSGTLAVLGTVETVNAYETHSSNVVISCLGTGPAALMVTQQTGSLGAAPVAKFCTSNATTGQGLVVGLLVDASGNVAMGAGNAIATSAGPSGPALAVTQSSNAMASAPIATFSTWAAGSSNPTTVLTVGTGAVGVGKTASVSTAALDVSGNVNASGLLGCISNSVSTTSSTVAASSTAVKAANDLAALALPKSGGAVTGTLAVNKTSVTGSYALDVSGGVNVSGAAPICTNGVSIGTIITGTWLSPSYSAANTGYACYSVYVSPGTWLIYGNVIFNYSGSGTGNIYCCVGPSSTIINQGIRSCMTISGSQYITLYAQYTYTCTTSTTYYVVGYSAFASGMGLNLDYSGMQAVKLC